jgi:aryl-alcohol dehydrogenase-like predicted oxidoreductase
MKMLERNLGPSGLRVSIVGLGCNNFGGRIDIAATQKVVHKALDVGITLFDTADMYGNKGGSERDLGAALGERRKDIVLASKFSYQMDDAGRMKGGSRRYIMQAVEASLKRLNTDWIDLYQFHFPDPHTPMEESLRALDDLVSQGKVRYIGVSNHKAWQVIDALWISRSQNLASFVSCQDEYSVLVRRADNDLIPAMSAKGLGLLPYYPLASGLLTGKYRHGEPMPAGARLSQGGMFANRHLTESNWQKVGRLETFVNERGKTLLDLAFSWLACRPFVSSIIAGATKPEQVEANVKAATWHLSAEEMSEIDKISPPGS